MKIISLDPKKAKEYIKEKEIKKEFKFFQQSKIFEITFDTSNNNAVM